MPNISRRIEAAYLESDQRHHWVPCPACGQFQVLQFAQLTWPKGKLEEAVYVCEHCQARLANHQRHLMLPRGEWRPSAVGGLFVTGGCDVQQTRLEVEIIAWGRDKQSWSVDCRVLEGDTSRPEVWERLSAVLDETLVSESGVAPRRSGCRRR